MPAPVLRPLPLALLAAAIACTDRSQSGSELGRALALHLCPIQADCGCDDEVLISSCEAQVEAAVEDSERRATAAGLALDEACVQQTLDFIDGLGACGLEEEPSCPVYHARAGEGEACEYYDFVPVMTECRPGLSCRQGICRNTLDPTILAEGDICSDTHADHPTGRLGVCDAGLVCDSEDTRTCVPSTLGPPVPLGETCTMALGCERGSYCRPQGDDPEASEESPGVCVPVTAPGEPCTLLYECERMCIEGACEVPPPRLCGTLAAWRSAREMF